MPSTNTTAIAAPVQQFSYLPSYEAAYAGSYPMQLQQPMAASPSYIPAAAPITAPVVETIAAPGSYIPQPVVTTEFMSQPTVTYAGPSSAVMAQPMTTVTQTPSYLPAPMVTAAPVAAVAQPMGQSVIVDQLGDWLVCEDAMGLFYHHTPTQQSHDSPPQEFLMLFPQGYQPPPLGAYAAAGYMPTGALAAPAVMEQVTYAQPAITQMQAFEPTYAASYPMQLQQPMM